MGVLDFLEHVLPAGGRKVLGVEAPKRDGSGTWVKFLDYPTTEAAAEAATQIDSSGKTVFFAVNAFGDWYHCPKKNKMRVRTQENVVTCRSLFDDFDVDPKEKGKYDTREDAFADVIKLAKALKLTPTITSSGGGYHFYITLDQDVDAAEWLDLSGLKRDITAHLGLKVDRAVDMDVARILRPVGVHNRKYDPPRKVELLKQGKTYSVETVREAMENYIRANNVPPAPRPSEENDKANPFAAALEMDFPPSDANLMADRCAAIREFRDTSGNIPEPHWWAAIGVVKHCEDGERVIHEWSSGYAGYNEKETQAKIDEWDVGPTTCAQMDQHIGCMATCPFKDKCNSPITLGYTENAPSKAEATEAEDPPEDDEKLGATVEGQHIPYRLSLDWSSAFPGPKRR